MKGNREKAKLGCEVEEVCCYLLGSQFLKMAEITGLWGSTLKHTTFLLKALILTLRLISELEQD